MTIGQKLLKIKWGLPLKQGKSAFHEMIESLPRRFPEHGSLILRVGQRISESVRLNGVPDKPGIYMVLGSSGDTLYIGKAGTMIQTGRFKVQKLRGRLSAKQEGIPRDKYFDDKMRQAGLESLKFVWFVTFGDACEVLPAKVEADLLQAYFCSYLSLPPWNKNI